MRPAQKKARTARGNSKPAPRLSGALLQGSRREPWILESVLDQMRRGIPPR
jgi:hypothetical protein